MELIAACTTTFIVVFLIFTHLVTRNSHIWVDHLQVQPLQLPLYLRFLFWFIEHCISAVTQISIFFYPGLEKRMLTHMAINSLEQVKLKKDFFSE